MRRTRRGHRSDHTESSAGQLVRILVSGDFVEITHSFAFPGEPASKWHQLVDNLWPSGASFLAEVVEQFVAAASGSASVTLDPTGSDWPLSVNLEWNPFAKCIGKSGTVWRAGKAFATSRPLVAFAGLDESLLEPAAPAPPCGMLIIR